MAISSIGTPATSTARALCQSGSAGSTAPADPLNKIKGRNSAATGVLHDATVSVSGAVMVF